MSPNQAREQRIFGTLEPNPSIEAGRVGELDFLAQGTQIRRLRADGRELVRSVGLVIRDAFWGTHHLLEQGCETRAEAGRWWRRVHGIVGEEGADPALDWEMQMTIGLDSVSVNARLSPRRDFLTCRAGLMLLHPLQGVVGAPVTVLHSDGHSERGVFPELMSPAQPFFDICGLTHSPAPGLTLEWRMKGDVFEMEDQRNWSDASFKTYNRPLAWPCPYVIEAGECIEQAIELSLVREQCS